MAVSTNFSEFLQLVQILIPTLLSYTFSNIVGQQKYKVLGFDTNGGQLATVVQENHFAIHKYTFTISQASQNANHS